MRIPSSRAMAQTCCPAAPPKPTSSTVARVDARAPRRPAAMACAMLALATSTKPAAISSGPGRSRPRAAPRSARRAHAPRAPRVEANGKRSGCTRPRLEVHVRKRQLTCLGPPVAERARIGAGALGPHRSSGSRRSGTAIRPPPPRCGCAAWAPSPARRPPGSRSCAPPHRRTISETSVEVPPMSKPRARSKPAAAPRAPLPRRPRPGRRAARAGRGSARRR